MDSQLLYRLGADAVLFTHAFFVCFVVFGLVLVLAGRALSWSWVRDPWFRTAHLIAIGIVVAQAWLGVVCPLTTFELTLRERAGDATYAGGFVAHWVESMLFYRAPPWVFVIAYTAFGALVAASWFWVRPRPFARRSRGHRRSRST